MLKKSKSESKLIKIETVDLPTRYGMFDLTCYREIQNEKNHFLLSLGEVRLAQTPLLRLHSECFTGDVLGSLRCDCGEQLDYALKKISEEGVGAILYLKQEGRGIGIENKLKAYKLQQKGYDTVEANEALGFPADARDYEVGAEMLLDSGISRVRLLTNNLRKVRGLEHHGVEVVERIPIQIKSTPFNDSYLKTKQDKLQHVFK